ncbi:MAG: D-alanine--D-alanine ligase [Proteobacteria bacterium]|nr:D-alanine--D-alanine ligase [Pseudomonadota bacterium]
MKQIKTALLLGGDSPEREVSLQSAVGVENALRALGVPLLLLDPGKQRDWLSVLMKNNIKRVFNILHGGGGENGEIRGALNSAGIACTGSDVLGSALAMNKHVSKQIWRTVGIPTADWRYADLPQDAATIAAELPPPWFVKPAAGGSSTHTHVVHDAKELPAAIESAASEQLGVLVEQLLIGTDYTLSIVDNQPLPLIKIVPTQPFYDYHAKYVAEDTQFSCPCGLPKAQEEKLATLGLAAFQALHCAHWGRVDMMLDASGAPFFLEVNTIPGMTSHSLVPMAAKQAGLDFTQTVARILQSASVVEERQ